MLPTELLSHRQNGESIVPLRLKIDAKNLEAATEMIDCFQSAIGKTQGELDKSLQELEGDSPIIGSNADLLTYLEAVSAPLKSSVP